MRARTLVEIGRVLRGFFPRGVHPEIPVQRPASADNAGLRKVFFNGFGSPVRAPVIHQIYREGIHAVALHGIYLLITIAQAIQSLFQTVVDCQKYRYFLHYESSLRTAINAL